MWQGKRRGVSRNASSFSSADSGQNWKDYHVCRATVGHVYHNTVKFRRDVKIMGMCVQKILLADMPTYLVDTQLILSQHSTNSQSLHWPHVKSSVDWLSVNYWARVGWISVECRPTIGQLLTECWSSIGQESVEYWLSVGCVSSADMSADTWPIVGQYMTNSWSTLHDQHSQCSEWLSVK